VILPRKETLKKYGLSLQDWTELYALQDGKCFICERPMERPCVDHFHIRNWKKMKPEKRRLYVRGLLCVYCNRRLLGRGMSLQRAKRIVLYLERFEKKLLEHG
jgi:hypothetical protein